jgi:hypothetical protein
VQTVTVNPTPTVSLTPSSASVCLGAVVTLTAAATGAIDYSFNGPNNWQAGNTAVVTVNQYNPSYTVIARTALGCTSSASTTVAVEAAPVNVLLEASNTLVCSGTAVTLTVTPTDADAYSFDNGTTWQSSHTTSVTVTGNVTYTAKARSPLGCESAAVQESITVLAVPIISLSAASTTVCAGTEVKLTATAGASSYRFNNGSWQTSNTTSVTVNSTTTYTVKARTAEGCESVASSVTVTAVTATGNNGEPATACGCASKLINCNGICRLCCDNNCANWTTCGFAMISIVKYEGSGAMNYLEAINYCAQKDNSSGWRLPTKTELECMCANKTTLPGGTNNYLDADYWSSTMNNGGYNYEVNFTYTGCFIYNNMTGYVKCVKD